MATRAEERAAARLQERQGRAARMKEQDRINAEAEAAGAGGITLRDERETAPRTVLGRSKRAAEPAANKRASAPGENKLGDVSFASAAARTAAEEAGLDAQAFYRKKPSSSKGFTKDDVARLAKG